MLDNTGPVATPTISPSPNAAGWNNTETSVHWTATDAGAGVPAQPYETDLVPGDDNATVRSKGLVFFDARLVGIVVECGGQLLGVEAERLPVAFEFRTTECALVLEQEIVRFPELL